MNMMALQKIRFFVIIAYYFGTSIEKRLLDASEATITAQVSTTTEEAECPLCHRRPGRIHSRYVRQVADLPWMGCAVRLQLHVRRFLVPTHGC